MEFSRIRVVDHIERVLDEKLNNFSLHPDEILNFQEAEVIADGFALKKLFKGTYPLKYFLGTFSGMIATVFLCVVLVVFGIDFRITWISILGLVIGFCAVFALHGYRERVEAKIAGREWEESPFADFAEEYKGDKVSKICGCIEAGCAAPLYTFTVEHHPISNTRFLLIEDPTDTGAGKYYIDTWEKPKPEEKKTEVVIENKVAELL